MEMPQEDAALFWRIDTTTDLTSGEESTNPATGLIEATPVEGLCLRGTILSKPVIATSDVFSRL